MQVAFRQKRSVFWRVADKCSPNLAFRDESSRLLRGLRSEGHEELVGVDVLQLQCLKRPKRCPRSETTTTQASHLHELHDLHGSEHRNPQHRSIEKELVTIAPLIAAFPERRRSERSRSGNRTRDRPRDRASTARQTARDPVGRERVGTRPAPGSRSGTPEIEYDREYDREDDGEAPETPSGTINGMWRQMIRNR